MAVNTDRIYLVLVPTIRPIVARAAKKRRELFEAAPPTPGQVLFLGDSITAWGKWDELFPELSTINRGINGDTTEDVLARLDEAVVSPAAVSLLIGTNDLHTYRRLKDPAGIAARVEEIITRIQKGSPGTPIFLNSVTPRTALFAARIHSLNDRYQEIAKRTGVTYVDLWPALSDGADGLRSEFTQDHLHLIEPGYRAWSDVLRPLLAPFGTPSK
jgi:lysophospholipase L1-like esterase